MKMKILSLESLLDHIRYFDIDVKDLVEEHFDNLSLVLFVVSANLNDLGFDSVLFLDFLVVLCSENTLLYDEFFIKFFEDAVQLLLSIGVRITHTFRSDIK
jgi:hypothetical protein